MYSHRGIYIEVEKQHSEVDGQKKWERERHRVTKTHGRENRVQTRSSGQIYPMVYAGGEREEKEKNTRTKEKERCQPGRKRTLRHRLD